MQYPAASVAGVRAHLLVRDRYVLGADDQAGPNYSGQPAVNSHYAKANVIFLGLVGLGKSHLATALGYAACQQGMSVLFANAIDVINTLHAAQTKGTLKAELRKYTSPSLLVLDEIGYLPIDQRGADLLFQVISARYERGSIVLTTNKAYNQWPTIFNGDSTITSAVLDRLLHHGHTVVIEGPSYRMKDRIEN